MNEKLSFMDFCAGIGGGRLGLVNADLRCVAFSEIDDNAEHTYRVLYGNEETNYGDLTCLDTASLPDFDLLICGFPCQTFSVVGKRAGFNDQRGLIIYSIVEILKRKNVPYFILENVKGLTNHNNGKTFRAIIDLLETADYDVYCNVLNSLDYGVPQMRERVYFIGIKKGLQKKEFVWPVHKIHKPLKEFLCDDDSDILPVDNVTFNRYLNNGYNKGKYDINKLLERDYLVLDTRQSDLRLYEDKVPTLRTGRHGILYVKNKQLHKITGYEGLLLQGFPKESANRAKQAGINNNRLLSQAGNAMTVNVINALCVQLLESVGGI